MTTPTPLEAATGSHRAPVQPFAERTVIVPKGPEAQAAIDVIAALRNAGFSAFLVGGCVRDLTLGLTPKDYDVATSAKPAQVSEVFDRVVEVGVAFGVVRVLLKFGGVWQETEVATYRADGAYMNGRHPTEVRFTDAREDVLRRDFTLNGLLLDPLAPSGGKVIDWVDGIADLERGHLRAIGVPAQRFSEDALRLLRAVRFAARFGLHIEPSTARAIRELRDGLGQISRERVHAELVGMLKAPHAGEAVRLLTRLGLVESLWPALVEQDPELFRTERRLRALCDGVHWASIDAPDSTSHDGFSPVVDLPFPLALAGFLWAARSSDLELSSSIAADLRLSTSEGRTLRDIWEIADALVAMLKRPTLPTVRDDNVALIRLLRQPHADAALRLLVAEADNGPVDWPHSARTWLRALRRMRMRTPVAKWSPQRWVTGASLTKLGYSPSPHYRVAIAAAEAVQLQSGTAEEALVAARAALDSLHAKASAQEKS